MPALEDEATKLTGLIRGRTVKAVKRHRPGEVLFEFEQGTRLFINAIPNGLEFSVTERREA
jgi:hypothetical protein